MPVVPLHENPSQIPSSEIPVQILTQIPSQIPVQIPTQIPIQIPIQVPTQIPIQNSIRLLYRILTLLLGFFAGIIKDEVSTGLQRCLSRDTQGAPGKCRGAAREKSKGAAKKRVHPAGRWILLPTPLKPRKWSTLPLHSKTVQRFSPFLACAESIDGLQRFHAPAPQGKTVQRFLQVPNPRFQSCTPDMPSAESMHRLQRSSPDSSHSE